MPSRHPHIAVVGRTGIWFIVAILSFSAVRADVVLEWNQALTDFAEKQSLHDLPPPVELRAYAITHLAVLHAIERSASSGTNAAAAAAQAAHDTAAALFPAGTASFDALLDRQLSRWPDTPDRAQSRRVGADVAAAILAERHNDGVLSAEGPYDYGSTPGSYQAFAPFDRAPHNGYAHFPRLGRARPFALKTADQFRVSPPYSLDDPEYTFDLAEVRVLGGKHSTARTADETAIAIFWYENSGYGWNRIARTLASRQAATLHDRARLFAALNVGMFDALLASFDSKYTYNFWRPVTALHRASADRNHVTASDPAWEPLLQTPPMPDYPSAHAGAGGAATEVLIWFLGSDEQAFTLTSTMAKSFPGVGPRTFQRITDAALENAMSRLLVGIHFRRACLEGLKQGRAVGAWVARQPQFARRP